MGKIGALIQARVTSTRLPGKILKDLPYGSGISVLQQVIRRLKRSKVLDEVIVVTTIEEEDNQIIHLAEKENIKYFRGSSEDVLSRYFLAAKENNIKTVVRITSDCPCIDSEIVDLGVRNHFHTKSEYTSNTLNRTYPRGFDIEIVNFGLLERINRNVRTTEEKEHVTLYIRKNPHLFKVAEIKAPKELYAPDIRITIDTEEDYALLCAVFDYLYPQNEYFGVCEIVNLFRKKPWLKLINKKVIHKKMYFSSLEEEAKESIKILDFQGLRRIRDFVKESLLK